MLAKGSDYENELLGGASGLEMFGCCAPEGMRAIHAAWSNTIGRRAKSPFGPDGVCVNMSFSRESEWGRVVSYLPDQGRLTVKAAVADAFFLRPPHWAPRDRVRAFEWLGNMVTRSDPPATKTPLFAGKPRLPPPPPL